MKRTRASQKQSNRGMIITILIASLVFIASVVVIGVFVRKYRKHKSDQSSLLRTASPTMSPPPTFTRYPTIFPSDMPTIVPSLVPSVQPSSAPTAKGNTTTFYALGDAPYTEIQADILTHQILSVPDNIEFIIHLGDMRQAGGPCELEEYEKVRRILEYSPVPVLIIVGDNDANDCPNQIEGWNLWTHHFLTLPQAAWGLPFKLHRRSTHKEQFYFEHKGTLFLGTHLIGGKVANETERNDELISQWDWVEKVVERYRSRLGALDGRVVMFAHSEPNRKHDAFFVPFMEYYAAHQEQLSLLFMNGNRHVWDFDENFLGFSNAQQITVSGKAVDPLLKVMVREKRFDFDRRLDELV